MSVIDIHTVNPYIRVALRSVLKRDLSSSVE